MVVADTGFNVRQGVLARVWPEKEGRFQAERYAYVEWDKTNPHLWYGAANGGYPNEWFEVVLEDFDKNRITHTRGGWPAKVLRSKGPADRPIKARITFPDGVNRVITYQSSGLFYGCHCLDLDLVQPGLDATPAP